MMPPKSAAKAGDAPLEEVQAEPERTEEAGAGPGPAIISEEAMADHTATLEALAEQHGLDVETLVGDLRDGMLAQFKQRLKPWGQMLAGDQRDVAAALEFAAQVFVRRAVAQLAAQGRPSVRGRLKKFAHDGAKIVATLEIALTDDETLLAMNHATGKDVLVVTADADPFGGQKRGPDVQEDQAGLEFEAGSDRADDADLAAAGEDSLETEVDEEEEGDK